MKKTIETKDWQVACSLAWRPKVYDRYESCPTCSGTGRIGGHFKDMEGERDCPDCFGARQRLVRVEREPQPEQLPAGLVEHMRAAWAAYVDAHPELRLTPEP